MNLDNQIEQEIKDYYNTDSRINQRNITVSVKNNVATLEGNVPSYKTKLAAEEDAWVIDGVKNVRNNLNIKFFSKDSRPTDKVISERIIKFLSWHNDLDASNIRPETQNLWVTLKGTTPTYWEKVQAELNTRKLNGVVGVTNEIAVVPSEKIGDEIIAQNVTESIKRNTGIIMNNITVQAENGIVTLTGKVNSWSEKRAAFDAASFSLGVKEVIDEILVT